jgi:hypothetical protein
MQEPIEEEKIIVDIVVYDSYDVEPLKHHLAQQRVDIISEGRLHVRISAEKHLIWPALERQYRNWETVKRFDVITVPKH